LVDIRHAPDEQDGCRDRLIFGAFVREIDGCDEMIDGAFHRALGIKGDDIYGRRNVNDANIGPVYDRASAH
jgi:hypothetical protein